MKFFVIAIEMSYNNNFQQQQNAGNFQQNRQFGSRPPFSSSLYNRKIGYSTVSDMRRVRLDDNGDVEQFAEKNAEYLCIGLDRNMRVRIVL